MDRKRIFPLLDRPVLLPIFRNEEKPPEKHDHLSIARQHLEDYLSKTSCGVCREIAGDAKDKIKKLETAIQKTS